MARVILLMSCLFVFLVTGQGWSNSIQQKDEKAKKPDVIRKKKASIKEPPQEVKKEEPVQVATPPPERPFYDMSLYRNDKRLNADEAMKRLMDGNRRFAANKIIGPNRTSDRRGSTAKGQNPFAVILASSDSRVSPEIIFDQGIGDLFVVRTLGNVVDKVALGSIEYGVERLGARLVMVLGNKNCSAIDAAIKGERPQGEMWTVLDMVKPALEKVKDNSGNLLDNGVKSNVKMVVDSLRHSRPIISGLVNDGALKIVGGLYDLNTGEVEIVYNPCMAGI